MRIAVTGKGTYHVRQHLKHYGLRWDAGKRAWAGDVERSTVTLIRESVMRGSKNIRLVFDDPKEASEYYGYPVWECPKCHNILRGPDDLNPKFSEKQGRCAFCGNVCTLEEE